MVDDLRNCFEKPCQVYVRVHVKYACVCACHKARIESLRLATCEYMRV